MFKQTARSVVALFLVTALGIPPIPVAKACGPYLAEAVFTDMKGPDFDYGEYLQGRLGIVQPSYYDMFLYAAYRNLSGTPFSKDELAALNPAMQANPTTATSANERVNTERNAVTEETQWHIAAGETDWERKNYADPRGVIRSESRDGNYFDYYNCLPDAFKTARERLQQHRAQFGAGSEAVKSWLDAQKEVFANCGAPFQFNAPPKPAVIPVSAPDSDPPAIRYDRKYQIAAAYFYAGDYDMAAARFGDLAKTEDSPWHDIAAYLQARALIRKGTIGNKKGNSDRASLLEAEKILKQVVADPGQKIYRGAAQRRLDFLAARLRPDEHRAELAEKLTKPGDANFDQDQTDYFWLLDHTGRAIGAQDDLTNWIFTMKDKSAASTDEALHRWQETKSLPWLVAAICKANPGDSANNGLLKAALQVPVTSPAYATLLFHSLRIRAKSTAEIPGVIAELDDKVAAQQKQLPQSAWNAFLALRFSLAGNLDEFLKFAPRVPAGVAYSFGPDNEENSMDDPAHERKETAEPLLNADAAIPLNENFPLALLVAASKRETLPLATQRLLTLAAWTRAVVLKNDEVSRELAPRVTQLAPELKPAFESYASAKSPEERNFAAVYAILRSPGLRPYVANGIGRSTPTNELDNLRDNWWCSFAPHPREQPLQGSYAYYPWRTVPSSLRQIYPDGQIPAPQFLTSKDSAEAAGELESLGKLPSAPDWLGSQTIAFAASHPNDPRVPEALHLVVRATRLGCTSAENGKTSKAAYDLLHQEYPESTWAKQTPYWFK